MSKSSGIIIRNSIFLKKSVSVGIECLTNPKIFGLLRGLPPPLPCPLSSIFSYLHHTQVESLEQLNKTRVAGCLWNEQQHNKLI